MQSAGSAERSGLVPDGRPIPQRKTKKNAPAHEMGKARARLHNIKKLYLML